MDANDEADNALRFVETILEVSASRLAPKKFADGKSIPSPGSSVSNTLQLENDIIPASIRNDR
jgi:hypothetical protein